jgi:hypothetical protein
MPIPVNSQIDQVRGKMSQTTKLERHVAVNHRQERSLDSVMPTRSEMRESLLSNGFCYKGSHRKRILVGAHGNSASVSASTTTIPIAAPALTGAVAVRR